MARCGCLRTGTRHNHCGAAGERQVRGNLEVPAAISKDELEQVALASDVAKKWLEGNAPKRVIVVPGKLVNLVP